MRLFTFIFCFTIVPSAFAVEQCPSSGSDAVGMCRRAHCLARSRCNEAAAIAEAASNSQAQQTGQQYANDPNMPDSSFSLAGVASDSASRFRAASSFCSDRKAKLCDKFCDSSKAPDKKAQLEKEKSACGNEIGQTTKTLDDGASQNDQAKQQSDQSGQQSQQQPQSQQPQQQQPSQSDPSQQGTTADGGMNGASDPTPQSTGSGTSNLNAQTNTDASAADCSKDYWRSTCQSAFASRCSQSSTDALCKSFYNYYCGSNSKARAGVSPSLCGGSDNPDATAERNGFSPSSVSTASGGGGGGSGLGGGSSGGGATLDKAAPYPEAKADNSLPVVKADLGGGGGGGGGGSNGGGGYNAGGGTPVEEGFHPSSLGGVGGKKSAAADAGVTGHAPASSRVDSPGVFTILSETYRSRCASGKHLHCGPAAK